MPYIVKTVKYKIGKRYCKQCPYINEVKDQDNDTIDFTCNKFDTRRYLKWRGIWLSDMRPKRNEECLKNMVEDVYIESEVE